MVRGSDVISPFLPPEMNAIVLLSTSSAKQNTPTAAFLDFRVALRIAFRTSTRLLPAKKPYSYAKAKSYLYANFKKLALTRMAVASPWKGIGWTPLNNELLLTHLHKPQRALRATFNLFPIAA